MGSSLSRTSSMNQCNRSNAPILLAELSIVLIHSHQAKAPFSMDKMILNCRHITNQARIHYSRHGPVKPCPSEPLLCARCLLQARLLSPQHLTLTHIKCSLRSIAVALLRNILHCRNLTLKRLRRRGVLRQSRSPLQWGGNTNPRGITPQRGGTITFEYDDPQPSIENNDSSLQENNTASQGNGTTTNVPDNPQQGIENDNVLQENSPASQGNGATTAIPDDHQRNIENSNNSLKENNALCHTNGTTTMVPDDPQQSNENNTAFNGNGTTTIRSDNIQQVTANNNVQHPQERNSFTPPRVDKAKVRGHGETLVGRAMLERIREKDRQRPRPVMKRLMRKGATPASRARDRGDNKTISGHNNSQSINLPRAEGGRSNNFRANKFGDNDDSPRGLSSKRSGDDSARDFGVNDSREEYEPFAATVPTIPTDMRTPNIRGESRRSRPRGRGRGRGRGTPTPTPTPRGKSRGRPRLRPEDSVRKKQPRSPHYQNYQDPVVDDMRIPPGENTHTSNISSDVRAQTPQENRFDHSPHSTPESSDIDDNMGRSPSPKLVNDQRILRTAEERRDLEIARAKRKKRDDEEMFQGLRNFSGRQRGWNGELESDRQETIRKHLEQEAAEIEEDARREKERASARRPPVNHKPISDQELRKVSDTVLTRHAAERLALQDGAEQSMEDTLSYMRGRHFDIDAVIKANRAAVRRRLQRSNLIFRPTDSSPPSSASERPRGSNALNSSPNTLESLDSPARPARPGTERSNHRRVASEAESLAGSLKENTGESEAAASMRRPDDQSRAFGNDLTQFEKDERKRSEAVAANRQP
ncbi:hypothetical protein N431DRAFT_142158 [Stipitochalara longipes BDJ]|nr:hypothetical protein N431DRAFT_142158 [Stipitochalara longipes BDJ]